MSHIIACSAVRVLPAPPRSPAQLPSPDAVGIVFTLRGFAAGDAGERGRCRPESAHVAGIAAPVSSLNQTFPRGIRAHEQRLVRMSVETGSNSTGGRMRITGSVDTSTVSALIRAPAFAGQNRPPAAHRVAEP